MKVVDTRVRLLSEIINNIRAVKLYAYENFFGEKVSVLRREELAKLRRNGINRATMFATMSFIPVLAAVCGYLPYESVPPWLTLQYSDVHHIWPEWPSAQRSNHLLRLAIFQRLETAYLFLANFFHSRFRRCCRCR